MHGIGRFKGDALLCHIRMTLPWILIVIDFKLTKIFELVSYEYGLYKYYLTKILYLSYIKIKDISKMKISWSLWLTKIFPPQAPQL